MRGETLDAILTVAILFVFGLVIILACISIAIVLTAVLIGVL